MPVSHSVSYLPSLDWVPTSSEVLPAHATQQVLPAHTMQQHRALLRAKPDAPVHCTVLAQRHLRFCKDVTQKSPEKTAKQEESAKRTAAEGIGMGTRKPGGCSGDGQECHSCPPHPLKRLLEKALGHCGHFLFANTPEDGPLCLFVGPLLE